MNFVLAYKGNEDYIDLLPTANAINIKGRENLARQTEMTVTVPPISNPVQFIGAPLSERQQKAPFWVMLVSGSIEDYNTITQIATDNAQLVVLRLGDMPKNPITIKLIFEERMG